MTILIRLPATFYFAIAWFFLPFFAVATAAAVQQTPQEQPMNFTLVRNGNCDETCTQWVSAEGKIMPDTPEQFKALLRRLKGRKLPVVFQSYGGDVDAAIAIGRMIRAAGLETAVGRTQLNGCPMLVPRCPQKIVESGWSEGEVHSGGAYCFSACPLALAGGVVRSATVTSLIGVHQITNGSGHPVTGRRDLDEISTKDDPTLRRILSKYLDEMGVSSSDVFAMMGLATPQGIYFIQNSEALKSGVITKVFSYADEPGYLVRGSGPEKVPLYPVISDTLLDWKKPDSVCHLVNRAYANSVRSLIYHKSINFVEPDGLKPLYEALGTTSGTFEKWGDQSKWQRATAPYPVLTYPRFTDCTYVDSGEGLHIHASWNNHNPPQTAIADIWVTPDHQKLSKVVRRFPSDDSRYPSKTISETTDYGAARPVAPLDSDVAQ